MTILIDSNRKEGNLFPERPVYGTLYMEKYNYVWVTKLNESS